MKKSICLFMLLLISVTLFAQADSTNAMHSGDASFEDSDPFLLVFAVVALTAFAASLLLGLIGVGIACVILIGLTMAGILSISILTAWYKKSLYAGFTRFVYLSFAAAGIVSVSLIAFFVHSHRESNYPLGKLLTWGIPAGLLGGLACGWVVLLVIKRLYEYLSMKLNRSQA